MKDDEVMEDDDIRMISWEESCNLLEQHIYLEKYHNNVEDSILEYQLLKSKILESHSEYKNDLVNFEIALNNLYKTKDRMSTYAYKSSKQRSKKFNNNLNYKLDEVFKKISEISEKIGVTKRVAKYTQKHLQLINEKIKANQEFLKYYEQRITEIDDILETNNLRVSLTSNALEYCYNSEDEDETDEYESSVKKYNDISTKTVKLRST